MDFSALKKNEYKLEPDNNGAEFQIKGSLENHLNFVYTAAIPLAQFDHTFSHWKLEVELEDEFKHKFKSVINLTISDNPDLRWDIRMSGIIRDISDNSFRIANNEIYVNSQTIISENENVLEFSELQEGWEVKVFAQRRADKTLLARKIKVINREKIGEKIEIEGRIAVLTDSSLFIAGTEFIVDSSTEITNKADDDISLSELKIGMKVRAEGKTIANGKVLAEEIKTLDDHYNDRDINVIGKITAKFSDDFLPDSLKIDDYFYEVTEKTKFYSFNNEKISFNDLHLGEDIQVTATTRMNRVPSIRELYRFFDEKADVDVQGEITDLSGSGLTVKGMTFGITELTVLIDTSFHFFSAEDLKIGQTVRVLGHLDSGAQLLAEKIILLSNVEARFTITDVIEELEEKWIRVSGFRFAIDENTQFFDQIGKALSLGQLEKGDVVEIRATLTPDSNFVALQIWLRSLKENQITIRGTIESFNADKVKVDGYLFAILPQTKFFLQDGSIAPNLNLFSAGKIVEVLASKNGNNWQAESIALQEQLDEEFILKGQLEGIGLDWIILFNKTAHITANTEFRDIAGQPVNLVKFNVGDEVQVRAKGLPDGSLFCWRLQKINDMADTVEVEGPVKYLTSEKLNLNNISFMLDNNFEVIGPNGTQLSVSEFPPGLIGKVRARKIGSLLFAFQLKLSPRAAISGKINQYNNHQFKIAENTFALASDALVLNNRGIPMALDSIRDGQQIQAVADMATSTPVVLRVRVLRNPVITSVVETKENKNLPQNFALLQSYPNPISSRQIQSTRSTIRFLLAEPSGVTLKVFNMLGQEVRSLIVQQNFSAGQHNLRWDGLDNHGARVASGLYFYRLQAGNRLLTKKIIILP